MSTNNNEIVIPASYNAIDTSITTNTTADETNDEENSSCSICIEQFTAKLRRCLQCPYCSEKICSQCLEKYLLNTIEDPHCVNCRRGWSQTLLQTFCTKTFLTKTYANYRGNILLNRNKSYLPQYQEQATRVRAADNFREHSKKFNEHLENITKKYNEVMHEYERERGIIMQQIITNDRIAADIETGRRTIDGEIVQHYETQHEEQKERRKFIRRCPTDGCNGFLSSVWKCGLCSNWTCPDCFIVKGQDKDVEHICSTEDKATADEIRRRTKPCPNCGELIEKASGCDQMFCTSCHSPFSWSRCEIIKTGVIHNPHYFEWLTRNGGNVNVRHHMDIPCGGLPDFRSIFSEIREISFKINYGKENNRSIIKDITDNLTNAYRTCAHIIDVERYRWITHTQPDTEVNTNLGIQYLLGNISEKDWQGKLKINEQRRIKSKEIREILDAFNNAAVDIWRQINGYIVDKKLTRENFIETITVWKNQLNELRNFINPPLWEISRIYNCMVPQISNDFKCMLTSVSKERRLERMKMKALENAEKAYDSTTTPLI